MQISCEKCSTTYVLDDRLIPPGGAPVQCTRCGHVFLAIPESEVRRSGTQIFGMPMPGAFEDKPEAKTKIFGDSPPAAPAAPPQPPRTSTQMFGGVKPPPPEPPRTSTQMFGGVKPPPPEPPRTSTQMFGATNVEAPRTKTPAVDARAASAPTAAMFLSDLEAAVAAASPSPPPDWRTRTQIFGGPAAAAPAPAPVGEASLPKVTFGGAARVQDDARATERGPSSGEAFRIRDPKDVDPAMATTAEMTTGALERALAAQQRRMDPQSAPTPAAGTGLAPALPPEPKTEGAASPFEATTDAAVPALEEPPDSALAGQGPTVPYAKVELPPDLAEVPGLSEQEPRTALTAAGAPPSGQLRWIAFALVALAVAGGALLGYRILDRRLKAIPPAVVAGREAASMLLRRDDPESRQRAAAQFEALLQLYPNYVDAEADLVAALALDVDDARLERDALVAQAKSLEEAVVKLNELKSPSDWQNRVNAMADEAQALRGRVGPVEAKLSTALQRADAEFQKMVRAEIERGEVPPATAALLARARALYLAVKGAEQASESVAQYRSLGDGGGWAEIAEAELALNGHVSDDALERSVAAMERAVVEDKAFIRPYVLRARLASAQGRLDVAAGSLEVALALNPNHPVARALLDQVDAALRQRSEAEQPPAPPDSVP